MRNPRILLTGGGTGGHVFPLVAIARELKKKEAEIAFVGPEEYPLDALREEDILVYPIIRAGKFRRYFSFKTIWEFIKLPIALIQGWLFVYRWKPDVILGKGGYGSIAPVVASHLLDVPIILHESDALPGLANKFLARFSNQILISFKETKDFFHKKSIVLTGNPSRIKKSSLKENQAGKILDLNTRKKTILILGGSQGAVSINKLINQIAQELAKNYALIISAGENNGGAFKEIKNRKNVVIKKFLNDEELTASYTLADLVISRAGAGGMFETALFGKPSITIPLASSSGGHQLKNAQVYEEAGATIVLEEKNLNEQVLLFSIESIMKNPRTQEYMSQQALKFSKPNADKKIAEILINKARNKIWGKIIK